MRSLSFLRLAGAALAAGFAALVALPASAQTTTTFTPNPADLGDLDHYSAYAWRVNPTSTIASGTYISGAKLTFKNLYNWDNNPNKLFIHLLDTATGAGVTSFTDSNNDTTIEDNFAAPLDAKNPLFDSKTTANTFLTAQSFPGSVSGAVTLGTGWSRTTTNGVTSYDFTFTQIQCNTLLSYWNNGKDFALGFDPDCHYYNDGISLAVTVAPGNPPAANAVPEPGTLALGAFALPILGVVARARRKK